ncbi:MAG: DNA ligase-1 [Paraglaciecola sp.]|jgi:DNA ligase-1
MTYKTTNMRQSSYLQSLISRIIFCFLLIFYYPSSAAVPPSIELSTAYRDNIEVSDYWISEKLDGIRARWDGQRLVSKGGNPFNPPPWFIAGFPAQALDGELWIARGRFEETASIVMRTHPGKQWQSLKFMLFDLPNHRGTFSQRLEKLAALVAQANSPYLELITQYKLADKTALMNKLDDVAALNGEGLMLHHQDATYAPKRSAHLLKLKKYQDAEAKVVGHLPGKGKYQGLVGSLLVQLTSGEKFKLGSGLSDHQRLQPPPVGAIITFKYYGKTARGIPRFASFMRIRNQH